MKKTVLGVLILLLLVLYLPSCAPAISQEEYDKLKSDLDVAQQQVEELTANLATLQAEYQHLLQRLEQSTLEDPTWEELKEFLKRDDTDKLVYDAQTFDCSGFAITLRDHAWRYGLRCAYVELSFPDGEGGHALNAFRTPDGTIIYVDCTEYDTIAYVQNGKEYGVISLDAVKSRYIDCEGNPDEFWVPLTYTTTTNELFSYGYFTNYQGRCEFYLASVNAYNQAVAEYNSGSREYSYEQLRRWNDNLDALQQDLGTIWEPLEVVENIEIYWN